MQKNKNVVEDTLLQIKNLEEALQENAKGILHSTMKEEIKQLVKESLNEQEDDEIDDEVETVSDDETLSTGDESDDELDLAMSVGEPMNNEVPDENDEEPIDMTTAPDSEVLRVFRAMGPEDGIIVKKEDDMINIKDGDKEYMIQLGESEEEFGFEADLTDDDFPEDLDEMMFSDSDDDFDDNDEDEDDEFSDGYIYEIVMDEEETADSAYDPNKEAQISEDDDLELFASEEDDDDDEDYNSEDYTSEDLEEEEEDLTMSLDDAIMEAIKKTSKPKGVGIGNGPKFKYGKTTDYPTKKQKSAFGSDSVKAKGTGKAKFEYDEEVNMDGYSDKKPKKSVKKVETKEASRTLGAGRYWGKPGLPKPKAAPRHLRKESVENEVSLLREKNDEYKKALDVFRNKLNEVAVFNSNLAYATRLFTEHSTTKQEKINILRRFDSVETLKESKNLYRTIKDELGSTSKGSETTIKESFERNVVKTPSTGSSTNLIESKTYENPQFLRMKDLMSKLK
jgi:hypothetical protein